MLSPERIETMRIKFRNFIEMLPHHRLVTDSDICYLLNTLAGELNDNAIKVLSVILKFQYEGEGLCRVAYEKELATERGQLRMVDQNGKVYFFTLSDAKEI